MAVDTTQSSLLEDAQHGVESRWQELVELYLPFVRTELSRLIPRLQAQDIEDISQDVLTVVVLRLASFHHKGRGSFRAFLREVTRRQSLVWLERTRRFRRVREEELLESQRRLNQWARGDSELSRQWDAAHAEFWAARVIEETERRCSELENGERDFQLFRLVHLDGMRVVDAIAECGVSLATGYRSLQRVVEILRDIRRDWAEVLE